MSIPSLPSATRHILVVEDDRDLREMLRTLLEGEGYGVSEAANGADALALLRAGTAPDLILLDLMMPVMDGWEFRLQQRQDPALASIPVLVLSATDPTRAAALEVTDYVPKPFSFEHVIKSVTRVMAGLTHGRAQMQRVAHTERLAALGTLAAGVAHEINNPLGYVLGNLQFALSQLAPLFERHAQWTPSALAGALSQATASTDVSASAPGTTLGDVRAALDEAIEGAHRIGAIVGDIRSLSSSDDSRRAAVDLQHAAETALNVVGNELRHRARVVKDYRGRPVVFANEGRIVQLFVNLLLHAAQAIPEGAVRSNQIRVVIAEHDGGAVAEVHDSGRGIAAEALARVFEPFFASRPAEGVAKIGLSVCHGIVRSLGGTITAHSDPASGTVITVRLPTITPSPSQAPPAAPSVAAPPPRARVLIIDDEPALLRAFKRLLAADHEVITVASGREALALLQQNAAIDVILCDLLMPEMTGMEVYEAIARAHPSLAPRMIFMTGCAFTERARRFVGSVPNATLAKPVDAATLREAIASTARSSP